MSYHWAKGTLLSLVLLSGQSCTGDSSPGRESGAEGTLEAKDSTVDPNQEIILWQADYDQNGRLAEIASLGATRTLRYTLDEEDPRVLIATSTNDQIQYAYDRHGRLASRESAAERVYYDYDAAGNLSGVRGPGDTSVQYLYDTFDRVRAITLDGEPYVSYRRDFLGRVVAIETPAGTIRYDFDGANHRRIRTLPNGLRTVWEYGPDGKLRELTHVSRSDEVVTSYTYRYRPDDLIERVAEWHPSGPRSVTYSYDVLQRLVGVESEGYRKVYRYNSVGDRVAWGDDGNMASADYDWAGRVLHVASSPCRYDKNGNLASYALRGEERRFEFRADNLLARASHAEIEYAYDDQGLLKRRTHAQGHSDFVSDPMSRIWRPLAQIDSAKRRTVFVWEDDAPLVAITDGVPEFFLHDHLQSVRVIADGDGRVTARRDYDEFGDPIDSVAHAALTPGFGSMFYDAAAGVYLTRLRAYDPRLGRFLQVDPEHRIPFVGQHKNWSLYAYCESNPVNFTDRTGASPEYDANAYYRDAQAVISRYENDTAARQRLHDAFDVSWKQYAQQAQADLAARMLEYGIKTTDNLPTGPLLLGVLNTVNAARTFMDYTRYLGESMMILNPPSYLSEKTAEGWEGSGAYHRGDDFVRFQENLTTSASSWWKWFEAGEISRRTVTQVHSDFGEQTTVETTSTPATSFFERFLMHTFPLGSYYDPDATSSTTTRTTHEEYRETTDRGIKRRVPIEESDDDDEASPGGGEPPPPPDDCGAPPEPISLLPDATGSQVSSNELSPVGGVYLRGAGQALEGLGSLAGVLVDDAGRLVLVSVDNGPVELPPLRIDDVVTVFRGVYDHGEAPFVSIDPDPTDPHGPRMQVRYGPGAEKTYTGWTLFESDRIMKRYSLGHDNVTGEDVKTNLPGYDETMALRFDGENNGRVWERFWIVPSLVRRSRSSTEKLTVLHVPLEVRTERMTLVGGKLVTADDSNPSKHASAFASWFTKRFDNIAKESGSVSPLDGRVVSALSELRRIALIAAIAENLRDQGVAMPAWMRKHSVAPCATDSVTPSITVESESGASVVSVFGGVSLTPEDAKVSTLRPDTVPGHGRLDDLEQAILTATTSQPAMEMTTLTHNGVDYQAVALPGPDFRDGPACVLREIDVLVQIGGGHLTLVRHYNSFFTHDGSLGSAWTLDLPELHAYMVPTERSGGSTRFRTLFRLESPLGAVREEAPHLFEGHDPRLGFATRFVQRRGGSQWHFDEAGRLVAIIGTSIATVYKRQEGSGLIEEIQAWRGPELHRRIEIVHDSEGRMAHVTSDDGAAVQYEYDLEDRMRRVTTPSGVIEYEYKDGVLTAVLLDGAYLRRFECEPSGRLARVFENDRWSTIQRLLASNYLEISKVSADGTVESLARYDANRRPIRQRLAGGAELTWKRSGHHTDVRLALPDDRSVTLKSLSNGSARSLRIPGGGTFDASYDETGHLLELHRNDELVVENQWLGNGRLASARYETVTMRFGYDESQCVNQVTLSSPDPEKSASEWLQIGYDQPRRRIEMRDHSGTSIIVTLDENGHLVRWESGNPGSVSVNHSPTKVAGRTTWQSAFAVRRDEKTGQPTSVETKRGDSVATRRYDSDGRLASIAQFDGGEYEFNYDDSPDGTTRLSEIVLPDGTRLAYTYNKAGQVSTVRHGDSFILRYSYSASGCLTGCSRSKP